MECHGHWPVSRNLFKPWDFSTAVCTTSDTTTATAAVYLHLDTPIASA